MYVLPSPEVQGLLSVNALVASADSESMSPYCGIFVLPT